MKNMIIIGASSGIGEALALESAKRGYHLVLCARRVDKLLEVKEKILTALADKSWQPNIIVGQLDISQSTQDIYHKINEWNQQIGGLNYFILNAGIEEQSPIGQLNTKSDENMVNINLTGMIKCNEVAIKILCDNNRDKSNKIKTNKPQNIATNAINKVAKVKLFRQLYKSIDTFNTISHKVMNDDVDLIGQVMVTSSVSAFIPLETNPVYAATKSAVTHYFEGIRNSMLTLGISVNIVHPGFIETPMTAGLESRIPKKLIADVTETAQTMLTSMENNECSVIVPNKPWTQFVRVYRHLPNKIKALLPT